MSTHVSHQMQLTSLFQYFPSWTEEEFNQAFRQETKRDIIKLLQKHKSLTDREMSQYLGYADPNKVRPRRHELMKAKIVEEDTKRPCAVGEKLSIAWRLNREKLFAFIHD